MQPQLHTDAPLMIHWWPPHCVSVRGQCTLHDLTPRCAVFPGSNSNLAHERTKQVESIFIRHSSAHHVCAVPPISVSFHRGHSHSTRLMVRRFHWRHVQVMFPFIALLWLHDSYFWLSACGKRNVCCYCQNIRPGIIPSSTFLYLIMCICILWNK